MENTDDFKDFIQRTEPIRMREPLAETLGVFKESDIVEYSLKEVIKLSGHLCPTVTGAYLCCKKALKELYGENTPVRGEISITMHGEPDESNYGVISQVFSFITGAASSIGFKGIKTFFKRKDLLQFPKNGKDAEGLKFEFKRNDNGKKVTISFLPQNIPVSPEESNEINELIQKVLWGAAKKEEVTRFQDLWMKKIKRMLNEENIDKWMVIKNE